MSERPNKLWFKAIDWFSVTIVLWTGKIWLAICFHLYSPNIRLWTDKFSWKFFKMIRQTLICIMSPDSNLGLIQNSLLAFSWKWLVIVLLFIFICMHHQVPPFSSFLLVLFEIYLKERLLAAASGIFICVTIQKVIKKKDIEKIFYHSNILFVLFVFFVLLLLIP